MLVLGIEAATGVAGVAVVKEGVLLAERFANNRRSHSVNLLAMIEGVLDDAQAAPQQLGGIAVSSGPGSFTGLRIGLVTAKTLAQVWGLPLAGVGTLEALAFEIKDFEGLLCPVIGARKNEVYAAVYKKPEKEKKDLAGVAGPQALEPAALAEQLRAFALPVLFTGDGALLYRELFSRRLGKYASFRPPALSYPRGAAVAFLGARKLAAGGGSDPVRLTPFYLQPSEAEVKWQRAHQGETEI